MYRQVCMIAVVITLTFAYPQSPSDFKSENYPDKFDNIDISALLSNKRLIDSYVKCVLDEGKCNAQGEQLKKYIPDALQTGCSKCTDAQRMLTRQVLYHLIKNDTTNWNLLEKKYDPERTYQKRYAEELKNALGAPPQEVAAEAKK